MSSLVFPVSAFLRPAAGLIQTSQDLTLVDRFYGVSASWERAYLKSFSELVLDRIAIGKESALHDLDHVKSGRIGGSPA